MTITVWLLDARDVPGTTLVAAERRLGTAARERLAAMHRSVRRQQFVLGRALLRLVGLRECAGDESAVRIVERPDDAPALELSVGTAPYFSLSHSWPWIACATSHSGEVGLDVQTMDASRDVVALSAHAFTPAEHEWLLRQDDRIAAFYRLWTANEASTKLATRIGALSAGIQLHHEHPESGLALTVASRYASAPPIVRRVSIGLSLELLRLSGQHCTLAGRHR